MKRLKNDNLRAFFYLLPALIIIVMFQFYPIIKSFLMGFYTDFDYLTNSVYEVGIDNFVHVSEDISFHKAIINTCVYAFIATPLGIIIALIFALILNSNIKFKKLFTNVFFLPFVTSTTAVAVVFRWMLNKDFGIVNAFLDVLGMGKVSWLMDPNMTIPILVVLSIWKGLGYKIIIFLASLQNIDSRYNMAGRIDGASKFQRICHITIPILKPTILFLTTISLIESFKLFDEIYVLYGKKSGPLESGLTIVYYIFDKFYSHWEFSIASAAAFILFLIILIFTILQFIITRRKEE
ncbi:MAG TPA: sugar ABC transporter permease [Terrisporobacter glycolicus]|uniref:carbohydrate ABC transporter permease n=1 Tax=Terrisporobacter TaxID=1505652 RepID=UPI000E860D9D|nr:MULTISPECIES: sugar ABC transporter permease [Terrisporobacter]MBN9648113.1 sugar ABC transporter permease [Terrisporobacter glycolicus]HBI91522.1 sugar ABC transporter permease [Terrisporobacter hibernicus]